MELTTRVQIQDEVACISLCPNPFEKVMNPSNLPPPMGKYKGRLSSFALVRQPV